MSDFDPSGLIASLVTELNVRYQFDRIDTMLGSPETAQIEAALWDALQDVNSAPPETRVTWEAISSPSFDPRWKRLVLLGAALHVVNELVVIWTSNGFNQTIDDLQIESKVSEYRDLRDLLKSDFDEKLERMKGTTQKFVKSVISQNPNGNILTPYAGRTLARGHLLGRR